LLAPDRRLADDESELNFGWDARCRGFSKARRLQRQIAQRLTVAANIFLGDEIVLVVYFDTLRTRKR
jgi:hypothetical protein